MRIAAGLADKSGCGYYRGVLPYSYVQDMGNEVSFVDSISQPLQKQDEVEVSQIAARMGLDLHTPLMYWHRTHLLKPLADADVVALHRQTNADVWETVNWMKQNGKAIVYDMDDDFLRVPLANPASTVFSTGRPASIVCEAFVRMADVFVTSREPLRDMCATMNPNIAVCPNAIDDRQFDVIKPAFTDKPKRDGEVRIFWAGTHTHAGDMATVIKPITKVLRKFPNATMTFMGSPLQNAFPSDVQAQMHFLQPTVSNDLKCHQIQPYGGNMSPVRYYSKLLEADADIAIAPLATTTFNRSKSNVKILEYALAGIATVATRFGPYKDAQIEGAAILTAAEDREWERHLTSLIQDGETRMAMALGNRRWLETTYAMSQHAHKWARAVELAMELRDKRMAVTA